MAVSHVFRGSGPYLGFLTPGLGALSGVPLLHGRVGLGFWVSQDKSVSFMVMTVQAFCQKTTESLKLLAPLSRP